MPPYSEEDLRSPSKGRTFKIGDLRFEENGTVSFMFSALLQDWKETLITLPSSGLGCFLDPVSDLVVSIIVNPVISRKSLKEVLLIIIWACKNQTE